MLAAQAAFGLSVVIVSYNGRERLPQTLAHLARQEAPQLDWELLLIDNNSSDATAAFAEAHWRQLGAPVPLRVLGESQSGTMYARRRGMREARFRYLLYCDDDNWLPPYYLALALAKIKDRPSVAAVGGKGVPVLDIGQEAPPWMARYWHYYGCGPQGPADGDNTESKGCLYTAGAILDRLWLERLYASGFQSTLSGRNGLSLVAGEDTELTYALVLLGARLHYYQALEFQHYMPVSRLSWPYLLRLVRGAAVSNYLLSAYHSPVLPYWREALNSALLLLKYHLLSSFRQSAEGEHALVLRAMMQGKYEAVRLRKPYFAAINLWKNKLA